MWPSGPWLCGLGWFLGPRVQGLLPEREAGVVLAKEPESHQACSRHWRPALVRNPLCTLLQLCDGG